LKFLYFVFVVIMVSLFHMMILNDKRINPQISSSKAKKNKSVKIHLSSIQIKKPAPLPKPKPKPTPPKPKHTVPPIILPLENEVKPLEKKIEKALTPKKIKKKRVKKRPSKKRRSRKKVIKKAIAYKPREKTPPTAFSEPLPPQPTIQSVSKNTALKKRYLAKIRELIKSNLYYPRVARRMRIKGVVKVSFIVNKNGEIDHIKVLSSANKILSNGAVKTLRSIKAPPIPSKLGVGTLELFVPIEFNQKDR